MDERSPWRGFLTAAAAMAGVLGFASGSAALVAFAAGALLFDRLRDTLPEEV